MIAGCCIFGMLDILKNLRLKPTIVSAHLSANKKYSWPAGYSPSDYGPPTEIPTFGDKKKQEVVQVLVILVLKEGLELFVSKYVTF